MLAAKDYWFDSNLRRNIMKPVMNLIPLGRQTSSGTDITFNETLELSNGFMEIDKRCIIIFPEGTRGEPDIMKRFRKGPARLAIGVNKPILPAVIIGSGKSWPKGKIFFRPGKIHVYILEPLHPQSFINNSDVDEKKSFKDPGYYWHGKIPQVVILDGKANILLDKEGQVSFDEINDAITKGTGLKKPDFDLTVKSFNEYNSEPSKDGYTRPRGT